MRKLKWYFDFISPFAYLQFKQMHLLPDDVEVEYVPVLFAGLLKHWGNVGPAEVAPKRFNTYRYCQWYADKNRIPFHMPDEHPFNPLTALRLAVSNVKDAESISSVFETIWVHGRTPDSQGFSENLSQYLNVSVDKLEDFSVEVKEQLRLNTDDAIQHGVFGVPTFLVGNQIFWGLEQFPMMLEFLKDNDLFQSSEYMRIAGLKAGKQRKIQ